jgi:spore germination protein GerM
VDRAALRAVALRVAALALLLLLALVAVLTTRTLQNLPDATIYLIRSEPTSFTLTPVARRLGNRDPDAFAAAAVEALARGPAPDEVERGLATAVPGGTRVLSARLVDGLLTVDLTADVTSGGGSASMRGRLEQLRWTLTRPTSVEALALRVEGEPLRVLGGEGLLVEASWRRPESDGALPRW